MANLVSCEEDMDRPAEWSETGTPISS